MQWSFLTPKAVVRPSALDGEGCFAIDRIECGETTAAFGGWAATRAQLNALPPDQPRLALQIDDDLYLVSPDKSAGDCINHSCDPNCGLVGGVLLVALRDIEPGEQVTFDYAMADASDYDEFECNCLTSKCRGTVTGNDWMLPDLRRRYAAYFSPYIQRRIAALTPSFYRISA
jgi:uncharacterized protein